MKPQKCISDIYEKPWDTFVWEKKSHFLVVEWVGEKPTLVGLRKNAFRLQAERIGTNS
jgi:hypothetical protein